MNRAWRRDDAPELRGQRRALEGRRSGEGVERLGDLHEPRGREGVTRGHEPAAGVGPPPRRALRPVGGRESQRRQKRELDGGKRVVEHRET